MNSEASVFFCRKHLGPAVGELYAKTYHCLSCQPTLPAVFWSTDSSVKDSPMERSPFTEAAWIKVATIMSTLGTDILASKDVAESTLRMARRHAVFTRMKLAQSEQQADYSLITTLIEEKCSGSKELLAVLEQDGSELFCKRLAQIGLDLIVSIMENSHTKLESLSLDQRRQKGMVYNGIPY